jgi:conjugal transfer pilus assembly protein TraD
VLDKALKNQRDVESAKLVEYIKNIKLKGVDVALVDALATILSNDRSYFEKLVSSLYPLLEKLTTGEAATLINPSEDPNDERPIFTWQNVMSNNAVVYVGLDALSDAEVAAAVGNAMFADLTSVAGSRYKYGSGYGESKGSKNHKVSIHADEFNELIGDEFIPMLNKAGGAGYQVTAYTQTLSDIEAKIGSAPKSEQIIGNLNTLVMLRVKTTTTAELLTSQLPKVHIKTITEVSGVSDNSDPMDFQDFASRNEDRINESEVEMLQTSDLVSLPKGQAFALLEGGKLYKVRLPMMEKDPNDEIPHHLAEIGQVMRDKYEKLNGNFYNQQLAHETVTVEGERYGD